MESALHRSIFRRLLVAGLWVGLTASTVGATADEWLGPSPYLCFDASNTDALGDCDHRDSPFKQGRYDYFYLEDFEHGDYNSPLSVPGVTASSYCGWSRVPSGNCPFINSENFDPLSTDSVDEDNGVIDGVGHDTGAGGQSLWGINTIRFTFHAEVLGGLPTHVGVVWTDGVNPVQFEAFDANGVSLGIITGHHADNVYDGGTGDDRFYGVCHLAGVSSIRLIGPDAIEADHLQFGRGALCPSQMRADEDGDGVFDLDDNCPEAPNPDQLDADGDGRGDACDDDNDNDGVPDANDNCPLTPNSAQLDLDVDGLGDACDEERDGDGVADADDNCPVDANADQADLDGDGLGDACDGDDDGDGAADGADNCPGLANADQADGDGDGVGDVCDPDLDNDGVHNLLDSCPLDFNPDQDDLDGDGAGDACDPDLDDDGVDNFDDNCAQDPNPDQANLDGDADGDACDPDDDGDGVDDEADNCPRADNADQADGDGDGQGDACDEDADGDGVADGVDNCPGLANADQADGDGDGTGDACDPDLDNDGVHNLLDNCPLSFNPDQADDDADGLGDACDEDAGDEDGDGVADGDDLCPDTEQGARVDRHGCSGVQFVQRQCPVERFRKHHRGRARHHHGHYVACVTRAAHQAYRAGLLSRRERSRLIAEAARIKSRGRR